MPADPPPAAGPSAAARPGRGAAAPPGPDPGATPARAHVVAAVFLGGMLGTLARAGLAEIASRDDPASWPWATFVANLAGAFLIGWWATRLLRSPDADPRVRPFLTTGICGGLTTFSTLQLELVDLVRADAWGVAVLYVVLSVVLGLAAVLAGRALAGRAGS